MNIDPILYLILCCSCGVVVFYVFLIILWFGILRAGAGKL